MADHALLNAWGEPVEPYDEEDPWHVPVEERLDDDESDINPYSTALLNETGDDLDGWEIGDAIPNPDGAGEPA